MGASVRAVLAWHYPTAASPVGVAPAAVTGEVEEHITAVLAEAAAKAAPDAPGLRIDTSFLSAATTRGRRGARCAATGWPRPLIPTGWSSGPP